jgi:hypothetical protein
MNVTLALLRAALPPPPTWSGIAISAGYTPGGPGCGIYLIVNNMTSQTVSISGKAEIVNPMYGSTVGFFDTEYIAPGGGAKMDNIHVFTWCPSGPPQPSRVIIREVTRCRIAGVFYRDCGKLLTLAPRLKDGPVPVLIDLQ